jgi:3D (Asp-Asp-Asp) domain-containing protein
MKRFETILFMLLFSGGLLYSVFGSLGIERPEDPVMLLSAVSSPAARNTTDYSEFPYDFSLCLDYGDIRHVAPDGLFKVDFPWGNEPTVQEAGQARPEDRYAYSMWVKVTAYCPCSRCCGRMRGVTKTGRNAWTPGVAVDPEIIPLGSHIDIPGYPRSDGKWIPADDTGRLVRREHIDVRFDYHWQAQQWGTKYVRVRVYPPITGK